MNGLIEYSEYVVAEFQSGIRLCKAPFTSMINEGDLIEAKGLYGKGKVMAVEATSTNDRMLNLLDKINYPEKEAFKVLAVYRKKEIEWKEDEENE
nr:MAG TPA: hypothetical protein [Caudoviricetes sp.]